MAQKPGTDPVLTRLRLPLMLTRAGLLAERVLRAFWPLVAVAMAVLAVLMLGVQDLAPVEVVWGGGVVALIAGLAGVVYAARRFRWPSRAEALVRLDATLPGRPIQTLMDEQVIGTGDAASEAVWHAHKARMAERAAQAKAAQPDLNLASRDPFALRYVALLALLVGVLFGSVWKVGSVTDMTPGGGALAGGPSWEGWMEPPRYTGLPTVYLNDMPEGDMTVPEGSRITLRFYGEVGALTLAETVSGRIGELPSAADPQQEFAVSQAGELRIDGEGGRVWSVRIDADEAPQIAVAGNAETGAAGEMTLPFTASDDYGVVAGTARIELDLVELDRRFGLAVDPEPREAIEVDLPMPIAGDRRLFTESLIEDFSEHPWANLPVLFKLVVEDAAGSLGTADPFAATLPARRFFDPLAAAVVELRRDLLWSRSNARRVAQVLRAVSHRPGDLYRSETAYLRTRVILRRLETFTEFGLSAGQRDEIAQAMWDLAILLEDGDLGDALERLRRAQERLTEAMKNGASDQEIAELMQELREATDDYMRQLSRQAQENGEVLDENSIPENTMQMTQNDLQRMMDRIQELMEQGRMAEAQQALQELQELMENMRITNAPGQGNQSEGQQAMEDLAETLRDQQGLSDDAFRDLQEQFNPDAQTGQSQGNEGRSGGEGRGQSHEGQGGEGQQGQEQGGEGEQGSLADRQQALRDELRRQQQGLPGQGTPGGDEAQEALDRAGRAMDGAEEALRENDMAGAIDRQSEAMEALREGMRSLGEALAQEQQNQPGQGSQQGDATAQSRDPLGRSQGSSGGLLDEGGFVESEDVYRRARELLDEIRRRSGDGERPDVELDYLKRLLERF